MISRIGMVTLLLVGVLWLVPESSQAQGVIPSGPGQIQKRRLDELQREELKKQEQREKSTIPKLDDSSLPRYNETIEKLGAEEKGISFELTDVVVEPESKLIPTSDIEHIVSEYRDRRVSIAMIHEIVSKINTLYSNAGHYNARARLPPQSVKGGVVKIQLVEGRLGLLEIENNESTKEIYFTQRVGVVPGEVVNLNQLARDMEWFNRTSDIQARARLKPGQEFGETDVILDVYEQRPLKVSLFADNTGSSSTGEERGGVNLSHASLLGYRDQLNLNVAGAEGELGGVFSYSVPVNRWNGRLGYSYADTDIDIVNGDFKDLNITGDSITQNLFFSQPVYIKNGFKIDTTLSGGTLRSKTELNGEFLQKLHMTEKKAGLGIEYLGNKQYVFGRLGFTDLASETDKRFDSHFWSASLAYLYRINPDWRVNFRSEWQYTGDKLLPSARAFQIGGGATVRGYDEGAVSGNKGYFTNLELHYLVNDWANVFIFTDAGEAVPYRPGDSYSAKSVDRIRSYGLGVNLNYRDFSASVVYGKADKSYAGSENAEHKDGRFHVRLVYQAW